MRFLLLFALFLVTAPVAAQSVSFTSSNLPIVLIETDGQTIEDEPKITARMQVIDNGPGERNRVTDVPNGYDGFVGIEIRGASSQSFPKKQYGFETRDAAGEDLDVSLLGLPAEEDWILHAPYSDKSLMRNVLAYGLARDMGRYASRTRYCEVVLNGEYQGVYILMEKIKRGRDRVDVSNLRPEETTGDDLTGGYIVQIDRREEGWSSAFDGAGSSRRPYYQYRDPDAGEIVPEQEQYIQRFIYDFESTMASDAFEDESTGYPSIVDVGSFVDMFLLTELGRNVDGYRLSSFMYKDKDSEDPLLHAGPVWDFNLAFGNADYLSGSATSGFHARTATPGHPNPIPFWWPKLTRSDRFEEATRVRWRELRRSVLHDDSLAQRIDDIAALLGEAQARNFQRWPVLGRYVWPNAYIGDSYEAEVDYLKGWLEDRIAWLDTAFPTGVSTERASAASSFALSAPTPNPSRQTVRVTLSVSTPQEMTVEAFDVRGRSVAVLLEGRLEAGEHALSFEVESLPSGVYVIRAQGETGVASRSVTVLGR